MKNYDETVDTVFDRIRAYNVKKKRRTVLACRITAACCAVSLLGGSVWYLNRPQHDIPVTLAPDKNEVTTTTDDSTNEEKLLITADEPERLGNIANSAWPSYVISPALKEKMELYKGSDVVYWVIVEIYITAHDDRELQETDDELVQLAKEKSAAHNEWITILKRDNPSGPLENGKWAIVSEEAREKEETFRIIADEYSILLEKTRNVYFDSIRTQRAKALQERSNIAPIPISTDTRFNPFFAYSSEYAFFMKLTADEIKALAELNGYVIRLVYPDGDGEPKLIPSNSRLRY